jgi:hypothetical protein
MLVDDAHVPFLETEDLGDVGPAGSRALRLVVDGEPPLPFPHARRAVEFDRVVVLGGQPILRLDPVRRPRKRGIDVAARLGRPRNPEPLVRRPVGARTGGFEIGAVFARAPVLHAHQCRRIARRFRAFGDHHGHRLAVEQDAVGLERPEVTPGRRRVVAPREIEPRRLGPILVCEDLDHPRDGARRPVVECDHVAGRNGACNDAAVQQAGRIVLRGVFRAARYLEAAFNAARRPADVQGVRHVRSAHQRTRLSVCDCGVPEAAWPSARTIARRASPILKSLWP